MNASLLMRHELEMIDCSIVSEKTNLAGVVETLSDAMDQSSETWHDNAPADAVLEELAKARGRLTALKHLAENNEIVDYPDESSCVVEIGTTATLYIPEWSEVLDILICGDARNLYAEESHTGIVDEIMSYNSPLARAVINLEVGDEVATETNNVALEVHIKGLNQTKVFDIVSRLRLAM